MEVNGNHMGLSVTEWSIVRVGEKGDGMAEPVEMLQSAQL